MNKKLFIIIPIVVLILCCLWYGGYLIFKPKEEVKTQTLDIKTSGTIQEEIKVKDQEITVKSSTVEDFKPKNEAFTPKKGDKYVAIPVEITNKENKIMQVGPYDFILLDYNNQSYTYSVTDIDAKLPNRPVVPGDTAKGYLTFAIPDGQKPKSLIFTPSINPTNKIEIKL